MLISAFIELYDTGFMDVVPPIAAFAAMGGSIAMAVAVGMFTLYRHRHRR